MSKYLRKKGHDFERKIARELVDIGFKDAKTMRAARGGDWTFSDDGRDIVGTPRYAFQCKSMKRYCGVTTIDEIVVYPEEKETRVVVTKANGKPPMAILPWEDLKRLITSSQTDSEGMVL